MGLFSFLKDAGTKLFKSKEEEQKANPSITDDQIFNTRSTMMRDRVKNMGVNIDNFDVRFQNDGHIVMSGQANTKADYEKAALIAGNISGIGQVDNQITLAPGAENEADAGTYEVQSGDSLWKIAQEKYGDGNKYQAIVEANQPMIKNENEIFPGQVLRIPTL